MPLKENLSLTLVVVLFNEERNLPALLESIKAEVLQDGVPPVELLFIDNNSSDKSLNLIEEWKTNNQTANVRVFKRDLNHMAEARQQSLELTTTEWLACVDADSILSEGWMKSVWRILSEVESSTAMIGGGSQYIAKQDWHQFVLPLAEFFPMGRLNNQKKLVSHVPTNNCLLRREAALAVGGFDPFFRYVGEDLDINVRLRRSYEIYFDPIFSVQHRLPTEITSWFRKMAFYGRAQSYVFVKYFGGLPYEKFIPGLLVLLYVGLIVTLPVTALVLTVVALLIPRTQFFFLTFMYYGLGEWVGLVRVLFSKKLIERPLLKPVVKNKVF